MTALSDAERAVAEARRDVVRELTHPTEWVTGEHGSNERDADRLVARLEAAVRAHDAEVVRADTGHISYGSATEYAIRHAALIHPASPMSRIRATIDPTATP